MNNEVWSQLEFFLLNLRCADMSREGYIRLNSCREAKKKLDGLRVQYKMFSLQISEMQRNFFEAYLEEMEKVSFEEQQEAYCQGIADCIRALEGLNLLLTDESVEKAVEKLR